MNETQQIEAATAECFLKIYNPHNGTSFKIKKVDDKPDVICCDSNGRVLKLEITCTADRDDDFQALLGRKGPREFGNVGLSKLSEQGNGPLIQLERRIKNKLKNDYGTNTALVIRDVSPIGWDWDEELGKL